MRIHILLLNSRIPLLRNRRRLLRPPPRRTLTQHLSRMRHRLLPLQPLSQAPRHRHLRRHTRIRHQKLAPINSQLPLNRVHPLRIRTPRPR
jgi:hypothetical protein